MKKNGVIISVCVLILSLSFSVKAHSSSQLERYLVSQYGISFAAEIEYAPEKQYLFDKEIFYMDTVAPGSQVIGLVYTVDADGEIIAWYSTICEAGPSGVVQMTLPLLKQGEQYVAILSVTEAACQECKVYSYYRYEEEILQELISYRLNIYSLMENEK